MHIVKSVPPRSSGMPACSKMVAVERDPPLLYICVYLMIYLVAASMDLSFNRHYFSSFTKYYEEPYLSDFDREIKRLEGGK